jgi:dTDP-4-dehydrorhamnose 3,5-epimerase
MKFSELNISGSWLIEFNKFEDNRGFFYESFRSDFISEKLKRKFEIKQTNTSFSSKGSLRGIHYALIPPSQAKYIQCQKGSIQDFIIDIRIGSPTFGKFQVIELSEKSAKAIFIEEGLAHAFVAMEDGTLVTYYVNQTYNPDKEKGINPFDEELNISWPNLNLKLSAKDEKEISLIEAKKLNLLPIYSESKKYVNTL